MPGAPGAPILGLPFEAWPLDDQERWEAAFRAPEDPFDEAGPASHLALTTRRALRSSYGIFLGFIARNHSELFVRPPATRLDRELAAEYLAWRRTTCANVTLANDLHLLRRALGYMCPTADLSWLRPDRRPGATQIDQLSSCDQRPALRAGNGPHGPCRSDKPRLQSRCVSVSRRSHHCPSCTYTPASTHPGRTAYRRAPPEIRSPLGARYSRCGHEGWAIVGLSSLRESLSAHRQVFGQIP
jgi:hypothetical protein